MGEDNLPVLRENVTTLEEQLRALDGPLSISVADVPECAGDVGDVQPNPRASDLGYADSDVGTDVVGGQFVMHDGGDAIMHADNAILDIREWA